MSGEIQIPSDPQEAFFKGEALGRVITYCEQLKTGTKLVGEFLCHKRRKSFVEAQVKSKDCNILWDDVSEAYSTAYIYQYPFVAQLIREHWLCKDADNEPSAFDIWASGKLFGYSDYEIAEFLKRSEYTGTTCRSSRSASTSPSG